MNKRWGYINGYRVDYEKCLRNFDESEAGKEWLVYCKKIKKQLGKKV